MSSKKWSNMICTDCKQDCHPEDFILGFSKCYKCLYKEKLNRTNEAKIRKKNLCRICQKEVVYKQGLKKRQRNVFCSPECALQGQKEGNDNHWTRKLREKFVWNH